MQPGKSQLHLRLHARHPDHPTPRHPPIQVGQQRRLPHSWLTAQNENPALADPNGTDKLVEYTAFADPVH
jgi:hypothetical protein